MPMIEEGKAVISGSLAPPSSRGMRRTMVCRWTRQLPMDGHLTRSEPDVYATLGVGCPCLDAGQGEPVFGSAGQAARWLSRAGDPHGGRQPVRHTGIHGGNLASNGASLR